MGMPVVCRKHLLSFFVSHASARSYPATHFSRTNRLVCTYRSATQGRSLLSWRTPLSCRIGTSTFCSSSLTCKRDGRKRSETVPCQAQLAAGLKGTTSTPGVLGEISANEVQPHTAADDTVQLKLEDLKAHLKDLSAKKAVRKVYSALAECTDGEGPYGHLRPDADAYRIAVRCFVRNSRPDLAMEVYKKRTITREEHSGPLAWDKGLTASIIRAVLRDVKKRTVVSADVAILFEDLIRESDCATDDTKSFAARHATAILSVISPLLDSGMENRAVQAAKCLKKLSVVAQQAAGLEAPAYNDIIRVFGKKRRIDGVFAVIDAMRAAQVSPTNETFEFLANSVVRQVEFVTGAVSTETLPEALNSEIAFLGRSNVGKSSLVNMICNRKALAYVSGRPGKTQQFNYFIVNGKDKNSAFYLVDLPGIGYAKVPREIQAQWIRFMDEYLMSRTSLAVVFHLLDGRHGALVEDEQLMSRIGSGGFNGQYVVVLTKMDKLDKQKVRASILENTKEALARNGCDPDTPIILTSASSRLGRDEMWRYLRHAIRL